jgi:dihydrofolate synthase/folylpolyglutamate synthase
MSAYSAAVEFLYGLERFGIKRGLGNIRALLRLLGNPEGCYPVVHIAGTNGKGSTASMLASILAASGYRTGLYTSPHLVEFTERIRVNGEKIGEEALVALTRDLRAPVRAMRATFFEATTAMAFRYFADADVDVAVVETGLGGRWDATNVVRPVLSIITTIGLEHTEYLGRTYGRIAFEKGGIIKRGIPCITGAENPEALSMLRKIAGKRGARLVEAGDSTRSRLEEEGLDGIRVSLRTPIRSYAHMAVSLPGRHQVENIRLAVLGAEHLMQKEGFSRITGGSLRRALADVRKYSGLRARLEVIGKHPLMIADVAHNPDGVRVLARALRAVVEGRLLVVLGVLRDKDYRGMVRELLPLVRMAVAVMPSTRRALDGAAIAAEFHAQKVRAVEGGTVSRGLELACREVRKNEAILVTGSHYTVGEALNFLNVKP